MNWKKILFCLLSICSGVVLGCILTAVMSLSSDSSKDIDYTADYAQYASTIPQKDCYLCGNNPNSPITPYLGENNIGIINLNTFDCTRFEINRYSKSDELIEKLTKYGMSYGQRGDQEISTTFNYRVFSNKGYLYADLYFNENSDLQLDHIQKYLCPNCLETVMKEYRSDERHWDIALIDFKNGDIQPFAKAITGASLSDYYISMQYSTEYDKLDLTAFYCPNRYHELDYDPNLSVIDEIIQYCNNNNIKFKTNDEVIDFLSGFDAIDKISYRKDSVTFSFEAFLDSKEITINMDGTYHITDFDPLLKENKGTLDG